MTYLNKSSYVYLIFLILAFVFYGTTLRNDYNIDDYIVTSTYTHQNKLVEKGIRGIPEVFISLYSVDSKQQYDYRPITKITFSIEWSLFGKSKNRAFFSHLINILLYFLCVALAYKVLLSLMGEKNKLILFFTIILFLIHPIHTEVVNNIKSRDELLAFLFGICSLKQMLIYVDKRKWKSILFGVFFLVMSLLSKTTGLVFVVLIPLSVYFFRSVSYKRILGVFILSLIPLFFKSGIQKLLIDEPSVRNMKFFENPLFYSDSFLDRVGMYPYTNFLYIKQLLFPYLLKFYYGYNEVKIVGLGDWEFYLSSVLFVILLYLGIKGIREKKVYSYAIFFFLFAIGGACNLLFPAVGIYAERFAFIASLGFLLLLVSFVNILFHKFKIKEYVLKTMLVSVVLISLIVVNARNFDWKDSKTLFQTDIVKLDHSAKANSLLGLEYFKEFQRQKHKDFNLVDSSIKYYENSLNIFPEYTSSANNLGVIFRDKKLNLSQSIQLFEQAIKFDSNYYEARLNLVEAIKEVLTFNELKLNTISEEEWGTKDLNLIINTTAKLKQLRKVDFKSFPLEDIQHYMINFFPSKEQSILKIRDQKSYSHFINTLEFNLSQVALGLKMDTLNSTQKYLVKEVLKSYSCMISIKNNKTDIEEALNFCLQYGYSDDYYLFLEIYVSHEKVLNKSSIYLELAEFYHQKEDENKVLHYLRLSKMELEKEIKISPSEKKQEILERVNTYISSIDS